MKGTINWTPIIITLIILGFVTTIITAWFYYYELRPKFKQKKNLAALNECEQKVYSRPNELNTEWAPDKNWQYIRSKNSIYWGWIYDDQRDGLKSDSKENKVEECVKEKLGIPL